MRSRWSSFSGGTFASGTALIQGAPENANTHLFVQSHLHEHSELSWILECVASYGELQRMTQFKDKGHGRESVSVGLFTYPVLQAADIVLYDADQVPVGEDQRQHLELCRDIAQRFNHRYGDTFVIPEAVLPKVGARIMDLQKPTAKMSKSADSPQGTVLVLDPPEVIAEIVDFEESLFTAQLIVPRVGRLDAAPGGIGVRVTEDVHRVVAGADLDGEVVAAISWRDPTFLWSMVD